MADNQKTKVTPRKGRYRGETIVEVSWGLGTSDYAGCLVSVRMHDDGTPVLEVYRADKQIKVMVPRANVKVSNEE